MNHWEEYLQANDTQYLCCDPSASLMIINYTNRGKRLLTRRWQVESTLHWLVILLQREELERTMMNDRLQMNAVKRWEDKRFPSGIAPDPSVTLRDGSWRKRASDRQRQQEGGTTDASIGSILGICSIVSFDSFDGYCFIASCSSVDSLTEDGNSPQLRAIHNYRPVETATDVTYDRPPPLYSLLFYHRYFSVFHFFFQIKSFLFVLVF